MKKNLFILTFALVLAPSPVEGQDMGPIKLTLSANGPPTPALRLALLPELRDQISGNGAPLYRKAADLLNKVGATPAERSSLHELISQWEMVPPDQLPLDEVRKVLALYKAPMEALQKATRAEYCDWEFAQRLREQGMNTLLNEIQKLREAGTVLCVKARLELADDKPDLALNTLRCAFVLGKHIGDAPILFCHLIGIAITSRAISVLEQVIAHPKTPNLYWSLQSLPQPFCDIRKAFEGVRLGAHGTFPGTLELANNLEAGALKPDQITKIIEIAKGLREDGLPDFAWRILLARDIQARHESAKKALIAAGRPREKVEQWPHVQVALMHAFGEFDQLMDDMHKWQEVPFWQAAPALEQIDKRIMASRRSATSLTPAFPLVPQFVPSISRLFHIRARLDRQFAALRCLEAIRLYAAEHKGQLPATLAEIKDSPIPVCPVTGKPFTYHRTDDDTAVLTAPRASESEQLDQAIELRIDIAPLNRPFSRSTMKKLLFILTFAFVLAQSAVEAQDKGPVKLTLSANPPPRPALRFALLPELRDQVPGNAAPMYRQAGEMLNKIGATAVERNSVKTLMFQWESIPLDQLPRNDVRKALALHKELLAVMDKATRAEFCNWEFAQRLREQGINTLIPEIQQMREAASVLFVKARLELAEDRPDLALTTLRSAFVLAKHVGDGPLLICHLVGVAIATRANNVLELVIAHAKTPNLYWSLQSLPQPFLDLRHAIEGERLGAYGTFPGSQEVANNLEAGPLTPEQITKIIQNAKGVRDPGLPDFAWRILLARNILANNETAKKGLIAAGRPREKVEQWPHVQVALMHAFGEFDQFLDEMHRCQRLPFWQAVPALEQLENRIRARRQSVTPFGPAFPLVPQLVPSTTRVFQFRTRLERQFAALRCLEAVRLFAAEHKGQLPATLADIKDVPIPVCPVTGKPFGYRRIGGDRAELKAPPVPNGGNIQPLSYELTFRR